MACHVCGSNENGWCEALSRHADTDPMGRPPCDPDHDQNCSPVQAADQPKKED